MHLKLHPKVLTYTVYGNKEAVVFVTFAILSRVWFVCFEMGPPGLTTAIDC